MGYSKDLFTCKVLDGKMIDRRNKVVNGVIYFYDQIYLSKDSKLKNEILNVNYEILISKPTHFIKTCHIILEGFMWEEFKEEMHYQMRKSIVCLEG